MAQQIDKTSCCPKNTAISGECSRTDRSPELLLSVQDYLGIARSQVLLAQVTLLAPIQNPPRRFYLGLAYRDHTIETRQAIPRGPTIFLMLRSALNEPHSTIVLPKLTQQPDYKAEFAFVIGKGGKNFPADRWQEHVRLHDGAWPYTASMAAAGRDDHY